MKRIDTKWFWFAGFALVWLALRVFWLTGDSGIPSLWEYGFNVTDEGYYMGAGKDKYLYGAFCDFARGESFTYGYSPLTHWLSYAGYCLFGLSDWAWRIPFVAIYFIAWLMIFAHVQKRCGNARAFVLCALFASLPITVAHERMAAGDVLIAALSAIAFCLAAGKGCWRIFAAAFVAGAISQVKPSVYVIFPIVAAGVLAERKTKRVWLDLALFVAAAVASLAIWKGFALLSVLPEASRHGIGAAEIIRRTTTYNALPSLLDYEQLLRGLSSFPRDISFRAFSGVSVLLAIVPLSLAAIDALNRRWSWRLVFHLAFGVYLAGVSIPNTIGLRYYHPVLVLLPILLAAAWEDLKDGAAAPSPRRENVGFVLGLLLLALMGAALIGFFAVSASVAPQRAIACYSNISNLPQKITWSLNGGSLVLAGALATACIGLIRGIRATLREGVIWFACAFVAASVALSTIAILSVSRYVHLNADDYRLPMALTLVLGVAWTFLAFALDGERRLRAFQWFVPGVICLSFLLTPSWRTGSVELLRRPAHAHREVACEIGQLAPANAVVIGERSTRTLMGQPYRTATSLPGNDAIPIVKALFEKNPSENVYAFLDSQNSYNIKHFQDHRDEFSLQLIKTFKMPSFANASPADVYFCKVIPNRPGVKIHPPKK